MIKDRLVSNYDIKLGQLFYLTTGEYSDYGVMGHFEALKNFNLYQESQIYLKDFPEQREPYQFDDDRFIIYLEKKGLIGDLDISSYHLSSYSNLELYEPNV